MKFTSFAILALFFASAEGIALNKKDDNGNGVSYDLDVPTLKKAEADNAAGIVSPALQPLGQDDYDEGGSHGFFVDLRFRIFYFDPSLPLTATSCRFLLPVAGGMFLACCGIAFYFIKKYRSLFWLLCG